MRLPSFLLALFLVGIAAATQLAAQSATEDPQKLLETSIKDVIDVLHSGDKYSDVEKRERILNELQSRFSFDIIIRRTLGRNWNKLNEAQQDRITVLITDLLIKAYASELAGGDKPEIKFLKTDTLVAGSKVEIYTSVSYKGTVAYVNYRLANIKGRGWQVYDVLVEGTSIVSNYRGQFDEHFQTKGAAELLELLESKIAEFGKS